MQDSFPQPDERTPRPSRPAKKGQPDDNPATMPPSPLDPRHNPEPPGDAPPQPSSPPDSRHAPERPHGTPQQPRKEKLSDDLLKKLFNDLQVAPRWRNTGCWGKASTIISCSVAWIKPRVPAFDAMCGPLHDRMETATRENAPRRLATVGLCRRPTRDHIAYAPEGMFPLSQFDQVPSASTSSASTRVRGNSF